MRFTCGQVTFKSRGTSGILLLTTLVFLTVSSVSSFRSRFGQCPNCSGQYSKFIDAVTGRCVDCWPCIECNDGMGPSVPCGSTVTVGTKLHCVQCVEGQNFSDSSGLDQCQPCGVCSGKHEHVLFKCKIESDVKCGCEAGFYWNQTTNECLPSVGSEGIKSLFTLWPTSSLVTSSYSHMTATPLLPDITKSTPVPSRTQQIRATSTSASGLVKHEMTPTVHVQKTMHMNTDNTHGSSKMKPGMIVIIVLLSIGYLLSYVCLYKLRKSRMCQFNNYDSGSQDYRYSTLSKQGALDDKVQGRPLIYSCVSPGVNELMGNGGKISGEKVDCVPDSEDICMTVDSAHQDGRIETKTSSDQPDTKTEAVQKGISSSLEGEPRKSITKGLESKEQCTLTTGLHQTGTTKLSDIPQEFINRFLSQTFSAIPIKFYCKICLKLDIFRKCFWDDYRLLGEKIGLSKDEITWLGQNGNPTQSIIQKFDSQKGSSIGKFKSILENMERNDVETIIEEWIQDEWHQYNNSSSVVLPDGKGPDYKFHSLV